MSSVEKGTICVFGAGGSVGAVVKDALLPHYALRFTDIANLEAIIERSQGRRPTSPGWDAPPEPPHEWRTVDVTDPAAVSAALEGCDAAINLTVNRNVPALAFRINVVGAYNVFQAAADRGLRRVIHTGPRRRQHDYEGDQRYDYAMPDDVPLRPGSDLYQHSKLMSYLVADAFAEGGLEIATLLLSRLRPADAYDHRDDDVVQSFSVSWADLGRAFLLALRAPEMPHGHEMFDICAQLPMDKYRPAKAERLLGWRAEDTFERFYTRPEYR